MPRGVYERRTNPIVNLGHRPVRPWQERFWGKVDKSGDCWLWVGARDGRGYGKLQVGTMAKPKLANAARLSYEIAYGPIPDKAYVLHRCDVRSCIKPEHLFLGDAATNMADMVAKNRQRKGEGVASAKLTRRDVSLIRSLYEGGVKQTQLARTFGVSGATINAIVHGRTWR
jgi:hypothetical protein